MSDDSKKLDELLEEVKALRKEVTGLKRTVRGNSRRQQRGIRKRSKSTLLGWPVYDIAIGPDPKKGEHRGHAKGIIAIGDIATVVPFAFFDAPPTTGRVVSFFEMIGLSPERAKSELARLDEFLPSADHANSLRGISPHAPYSVHPELVATAAARSAAQRVPLAFHLAEMREELQLLADGSGPLVDSLDRLGFWAAGNIPPGSKPLARAWSLR